MHRYIDCPCNMGQMHQTHSKPPCVWDSVPPFMRLEVCKPKFDIFKPSMVSILKLFSKSISILNSRSKIHYQKILTEIHLKKILQQNFRAKKNGFTKPPFPPTKVGSKKLWSIGQGADVHISPSRHWLIELTILHPWGSANRKPQSYHKLPLVSLGVKVWKKSSGFNMAFHVLNFIISFLYKYICCFMEGQVCKNSVELNEISHLSTAQTDPNLGHWVWAKKDHDSKGSPPPMGDQMHLAATSYMQLPRLPRLPRSDGKFGKFFAFFGCCNNFSSKAPSFSV